MGEFATFGRHCIRDLWGVDFDLINDAKFLEELLIESAKQSGATVLDSRAEQFEPQGATVVVVLAESHVSIHTYPEKGFCAIDAYTCGNLNPELIVAKIVSSLQPQKVNQAKLIRGVEDGIVVD